jgi:ribosomal protein L20
MKKYVSLTKNWNLIEKGYQYTYINRRVYKRQVRSESIMRLNGLLRSSWQTNYSKGMQILKRERLMLNTMSYTKLIEEEPALLKTALLKLVNKSHKKPVSFKIIRESFFPTKS